MTCSNCGQANVGDMRFCRACGKPLTTTIVEETPTKQLINTTGPAYVKPAFAAPVDGQATQGLPPAPTIIRRKNNIGRPIAIALVIVLFIAIGCAASIFFVVKPEVEKAAEYMPKVSQPTVETVQAKYGDLLYPGATPKSQINVSKNQLNIFITPDSLAKVRAYYKAKLGGNVIFIEHPEGVTFTFNRNQEKCVISAINEASSTEIHLACGADFEFPKN